MTIKYSRNGSVLSYGQSRSLLIFRDFSRFFKKYQEISQKVLTYRLGRCSIVMGPRYRSDQSRTHKEVRMSKADLEKMIQMVAENFEISEEEARKIVQEFID